MLILFTFSWRSQAFQVILALVAEHLMVCSLVSLVCSICLGFGIFFSLKKEVISTNGITLEQLTVWNPISLDFS